MSLSDSVEIPIKCPQCKHVTKKRLSQLQHKTAFKCTCGATFDVDPAGFKSAAKSLDDLQKALRKLGKS